MTEEEEEDTPPLANSQDGVGIKVQIAKDKEETFLNESLYIRIDLETKVFETSDEEWEEDDGYSYNVLVGCFFIATHSLNFANLFIIKESIESSSIKINPENYNIKYSFIGKQVGFFGAGGWIGVREI